MAAFSIEIDLQERQVVLFLGSEARYLSIFSLHLKEAITFLLYKKYSQISIAELKVIAENVNLASTRERKFWPEQHCVL